jgi:copper ion binding protein
MEKIILNIEGMSCAHCVKAVTNAVEALEGVKFVEVNLESKTANVEYDSEKLTLNNIIDAIEEQGYDVI